MVAGKAFTKMPGLRAQPLHLALYVRKAVRKDEHPSP